MRAQNGRDIFTWKCFVRYLNNAKSIKCMIYGMNMHHIYHAACAVLKKFLETYLPREAWRLVGPVVSSFPFARHLRRFTCKPKHTITVHACARVQCTEPKQTCHPTRERGMAEMGAKRTKFCRLTSFFRSQSEAEGLTATADANPRTPLDRHGVRRHS